MEVYELDKKVLAYLTKRDLISQYQKAKGFLTQNSLSSVDFKKRKPKSKGEYYFRINQKYRAIGVFNGKDFIVTDITDHQQ